MRKGILFSIIAAGLLCNMALAGENILSGNPHFKCVKEEEGSPITAIAAYDNGRSAICGDQAGNIYCVNADGFKKITSSKLGSIDSIVYGNAFTEIFCFLAGEKIYGYKDEQIIDISGTLKEEVKKLYKDLNSNQIYAITKNNNVYYLSCNDGLNWVTAEPQTAEKILKNTISDNGNSNSINKNSEWMAVQNISSYVDSHDKKFAGTSKGQIYATDPYEPQPMTVKADYVSDAVGTDTNRAIYRVTIDGHRLNTDDIFTTGYNGFKYMLTSDNPQYNSEAYPVNGVTYYSDGMYDAALQNREISFLWLGPKCSNIGELHQFTVTETAYNFSTGQTDVIDSLSQPLPVAAPLPDYSSNYTVQIRTDGGTGMVTTSSTGTCGMPFHVVIKNGNNVLSPDDDAYNHLVFYASDSTSPVREDGLVGSDPFRSESDFTAILPASCVEIDGYVKYGTVGEESKGRTFYAYVKAPGDHYIYAGLLKGDGSKYIITEDLDKKITIYGGSDSISVGCTPDSFGRNLSFGSGVNGSNWQGNQWGHGGYLDYQLTSRNNDSYRGIFVYLPEGLNIRKFDGRKDLRKDQLKIGYYIDPQPSPASPLMAVNYHINDTPSFCDQMRGQTLYSMLFDQYGRCATNYTENDSDNVKAWWDIRDKCQKTGKFDPDEKMAIQVGNLFTTPIIMGSERPDTDDGKNILYGITPRGLFVPPITSGDDSKITTFITDISVICNKDNHGFYKIAGYKLTVNPKTSGNTLFYNTLKLEPRGDSWSTATNKITLNVTDKDLNPLTPSTSERTLTYGKGVTSLNSICIKAQPLIIEDRLESWTIFHLDQYHACRYAYWYNVDYHKWSGQDKDYCRLTPDGRYYVEYLEGYTYDLDGQGIYRVWRNPLFTIDMYSESKIPPKPVAVWPLVKE